MSNKQYRYGSRTMTREEAIAWAPDPKFFDRASEKMRKSNLEEILMRNIQEIRFWLNQWEMAATGRVAGRVTKRTLVIDANRLHDWRAGLNIMSGTVGSPYLWEITEKSDLLMEISHLEGRLEQIQAKALAKGCDCCALPKFNDVPGADE